MQKARSHIAVFFLLLSVSLAFPAQYWHVHDKEEETTSVLPHESEAPLVEEGHVDCVICDTPVLNFAPMFEGMAASGLLQPQTYESLSLSGVAQGLILHHHQRGPPQA